MFQKTIKCGLLAALCQFGSAALAAEPVVLRVAHFWPPMAMSQKQGLEPWCAA